ncbi:DUF4174 domain-containing protein [Chelatococcus sambhunathii]|uniref:DUF4174 domain-containing protein n=1 Tax=Chelatococcus sambhunathii TaxID=363953 RepID=A0ABU1DFX1_9HYPH|nr:DUF4174 domain-containing protein [Chelatococcus sambhunathii]MDR4306940.1 DUF4174 domain-containing protein [Chelatococcus sambhunathii]
MIKPAAIVAMAVTIAPVASAAPSSAAGLDAYRSKARPVLVFAPRHGDRQVVEQLGKLTAAGMDLAERDMPVLVVTGDDVADLAGGDAEARASGEQLRKAYGVADGAFAVILVGKDGGEKFRSDKPVEPSRLTGLVDEMPMRRNETRSTGSVK